MGFYRRYMKDYSTIARPLNALRMKNKVFVLWKSNLDSKCAFYRWSLRVLHLAIPTTYSKSIFGLVDQAVIFNSHITTICPPPGFLFLKETTDLGLKLMLRWTTMFNLVTHMDHLASSFRDPRLLTVYIKERYNLSPMQRLKVVYQGCLSNVWSTRASLSVGSLIGFSQMKLIETFKSNSRKKSFTTSTPLSTRQSAEEGASGLVMVDCDTPHGY